LYLEHGVAGVGNWLTSPEAAYRNALYGAPTVHGMLDTAAGDSIETFLLSLLSNRTRTIGHLHVSGPGTSLPDFARVRRWLPMLHNHAEHLQATLEVRYDYNVPPADAVDRIRLAISQFVDLFEPYTQGTS
jgi:hypothetical protein